MYNCTCCKEDRELVGKVGKETAAKIDEILVSLAKRKELSQHNKYNIFLNIITYISGNFLLCLDDNIRAESFMEMQEQVLRYLRESSEKPSAKEAIN